MNDYTFYDIDGKIVLNYLGQCISEMSRIHPELSFIIGTYDFEKYYILNDYPIERPIQDTKLSKKILKADGIDTLTIFDAPIGSITIYGEVNNRTIESNITNTETFITTIPDKYQVGILAFPYLPFNMSFEAIQ